MGCGVVYVDKGEAFEGRGVSENPIMHVVVGNDAGANIEVVLIIGRILKPGFKALKPAR